MLYYYILCTCWYVMTVPQCVFLMLRNFICILLMTDAFLEQKSLDALRRSIKAIVNIFLKIITQESS